MINRIHAVLPVTSLVERCHTDWAVVEIALRVCGVGEDGKLVVSLLRTWHVSTAAPGFLLATPTRWRRLIRHEVHHMVWRPRFSSCESHEKDDRRRTEGAPIRCNGANHITARLATWRITSKFSPEANTTGLDSRAIGAGS
jgi:hypothetical protein